MVVDDEPLARSNLTVLLRRDPEIEVVRECGSGVEALAEIRGSKPDLVFLDVQMPECDGFDVLEMLGERCYRRRWSLLRLMTSMRCGRLRPGALDYLLKPFDNARFERALGRAKERIAHDRNPPPTLERFVVKSAGQVSFLKASEIDWIEAADYYSCLHVGARTHLLRRSMAELDEELDQTVFCRIHRSTIVRLDRVRGMKLNESGEYDVRARRMGRSFG